MKKLLITLAIALASTLSFAAGWDYFNPKGAGTQVRIGTSFDLENDSASPYLKARTVINDDLELSMAVQDDVVTQVSVKYDILDMGSVAVDLHSDDVTAAIQYYKDFANFALGTELNVSFGDEFENFGGAIEFDTFFWGWIQYAGTTLTSELDYAPYVGGVFSVGNVDLGFTYFGVFHKDDYIDVGWSADLTFKF